ncbi:hypothetical protein ACGFNU_01360 [Spirillospora sp. NPDC048911]|uniref:hypothetical protein n=1 Tax=Spirillospora sp. NPDC048911 TaxID=3364527 RepID=UPI003717F6D5
MEEAHRWWHGCLTDYDDPEGFRANLNACIQALRNVTWVLQKEKSRIPAFDQWYPAWQEKMKDDEVMRWVVKSRNRIVKMSDLELKSVAIARLIVTYFDTAPNNKEEGERKQSIVDKKISMPPRSTLRDYAERIKSLRIPPSVMEDAVLSMERRWVDRALPTWELLNGLAHAYGVLSGLMDEVHMRLGVEHGIFMRTPDGAVRLEDKEYANGRLPCMITTEYSRTTSYRIKDGSITGGGLSFPMGKPPENFTARAVRKYRMDELERLQGQPESIMDYVPLYAEIGKKILKKDKHHGWFIFYFRGLTPCGAEVLAARDRGDKMLLAKKIADSVAVNEFDGVIITGEMWVAPMSHGPDGEIIPPAQSSDRTEGLIVYAENSGGEVRDLLIPFTRRFGRIIYEDSIEQVNVVPEARYNFLIPVRAIWDKWNADSD